MSLSLRVASALLLAQLGLASAPARAQDADQDGAADVVDPFPCDADRSSVVYLPSEGDYGTLMFENNWPARGDLDFNDAVLGYNYAVYQSSADGVSSVVLTLDALALGAHFDDGLALRLPIPATALASATLAIDGGAPQALSPVAGETDLVVIISANLRGLFGGAPGFVNTELGTALANGSSVVLTLRFATPVGLAVSSDPFDLFFFKAGDPARQVHRPQFDGTALMNRSLFNTADDDSSESRRFVDRSGLPFVLQLPVLVRWTYETVNIDDLFPDIVGFAASGGATNHDFYVSQIYGPAAYAGSAGGGGAAAIPQAPLADRACVVEMCNGADENGDGQADEGNPGSGQSCTSGQPGLCSAGLTQCTGGALACLPVRAPVVESCNGADDDCDGTADDAATAVESSFASGTGGWTLEGDAQALRNVGGALVADDRGDGIVWYWVAPSSFGGDLSNLYGGFLSYRLRTTAGDSGAADDAVIITGANGASMQRTSSLPGTSFTSYAHPLSAGAWRSSGGAVLSEAQIRAILANVTRIRIRGEYSSTHDVGGLDDVALGGADPRFGADGGGTCATGQLGLCAAGTVTCSGGGLSCVRNVGPVAEACNALDDDCDGVADDGNPGSGAACSTGLPGVCSAGTTQCTGGAISCAQTVAAGVESCNGVDDDCDGTTDEGCAFIESRFTTTIEGWSVEGDGGNIRVSSGTLAVTDQAQGSIWFFVASAAFTGDLSAAYGGSLSYRLRVSGRNITGPDAVTIYGANGGVMQRSTANPTTTFTTFTLPLVPGSWIAPGGAALTEAQIRAILANVTRIRIRGEWYDGADTGYLDDVVLMRGN